MWLWAERAAPVSARTATGSCCANREVRSGTADQLRTGRQPRERCDIDGPWEHAEQPSVSKATKVLHQTKVVVAKVLASLLAIVIPTTRVLEMFVRGTRPASLRSADFASCTATPFE